MLFVVTFVNINIVDLLQERSFLGGIPISEHKPTSSRTNRPLTARHPVLLQRLEDWTNSADCSGW
jgi:hypothetical protein